MNPLMVELVLAFCGGLLGSGHCVGMCGAFALTVSAGANGWRDNARRQLVYTLGRAFTYGCAGLTAAFLGTRLPQVLPQWVPAQSLLSLVAGIVLVLQGLAILGRPWLRWKLFNSSAACQAARIFREILTAPHLSAVFLAGVGTGFLPCALIYAYLALAAQSGSLISGTLIMVSMALGTAPLLMLTGLGTSGIPLKARQRVLHGAAFIVLITGAVTLYRGGAYWASSHAVPQDCPLCRGVARP